MEKIAQENLISVSIVSHGQMNLVANLLNDIEKFCINSTLELIITLNVDEIFPFELNQFSFPIHLIKNPIPLGFGANHNQAFKFATGAYFCVLNPDIRLMTDPFPELIRCFDASLTGVVAPLVFGAEGKLEDSARRFPSPLKILCKVFGRCRGSDYKVQDTIIHPEWVGGMFMLFPRSIFERLEGFDQRYFLYYEDVDLCARLQLLGFKVAVSPRAAVIHHAQRSSWRSYKYFRWHLSSMMRFFSSSVYWQLHHRK